MRPSLVATSIILGITILTWITYVVLEKIKNRIIFNPTKEIKWSPIDREDIYFYNNSGNKLHGWLFNKYYGRPIILYCHGNYGNITYRELFVEVANILKCNIFLFDYSGYGESSGYPSLETLRDDSISAYKYVTKYYRPEDIVVFGKSLGGYSALTIASIFPKVRGVLILATFSTFDMLINSDDLKSKLIKFFIRKFTDNVPTNREMIIQLKNSDIPISILHSKNDEFIPYNNGIDLSNNGTKCAFVPINGGHASPTISLSSFLLSLDHIGIPLPITNTIDDTEMTNFLFKLQDWLDKLPNIKQLLDIKI